MESLRKEFTGIGEVKGFIFTQIKKSDNAYLYQVDTGGILHYEVFKHKINTKWNCISYPKSNSFGVWSWSFNDFNRANEKFELLTESEVNNG